MKRIIVFFVFLLSLSLSIQAQRIKKDTIYNRLIIGIQPALSYRAFNFNDGSKEKARFFSMVPRVYAGYNLYKNLYVGADFGYEFFSSNYYKRKNFVDVGVFARYWAPYTINHPFWGKFRLYVQTTYSRTNFLRVGKIVNVVETKGEEIKEDFVRSNQLIYQRLSFPIGLTFQPTRFMYLELNWQYQKFIDGVGISSFMAGVGFNLGHKHRQVNK